MDASAKLRFGLKKLKVSKGAKNATYPSRREVIAMMAITGIYLMFEVAFAARLLDVVGSTTDLDTIEQIERAGRIISGIALTLVVWTAAVLPWQRRIPLDAPFRRTKSLATLALSAAACCIVSFVVQETILDRISQGSSPAQRQAASTLTLVSASVQNERAVLDGIDFEAVDRGSPEAKTFLALLPALALSVDRLEERTADAIDQLLERQAQRALGPPGEMFTEAYYPTMNALKAAYNDAYLDAAARHREAIAWIPDEQRRLYREYRNGLGRWTPTTLPRSRHDRVRSKLRAEGVPVPYNWRLTDKQGFFDAVEREIRQRADPPYNQAMQQAFGHALPDDLRPSTFFAAAGVQARWHEELGMPASIALAPDLSPESFKTQVYDAWVRQIVAERKPLYLAGVEQFKEDGAHYADGIEAIRVAYVPLVAFGFSILGALVHSFKTLNFAAQATVGSGTARRRWSGKVLKALLAAIVIYTGVGMAREENPVTQSVLFRDLEATTTEVAGPIYAAIIRSIIQLQAHLYPAAEAIRRHLLLGITYDFDPETETPAFETLASTDDLSTSSSLKDEAQGRMMPALLHGLAEDVRTDNPGQ